MITRNISIIEAKQLFVEMLLNNTDKLTKVSNESINNGVAYGVAKIFQKGMKDVALVESHLFPSYAFESHLDEVAEDNGISGRFGTSKSSTYVRVVGSPGTMYQAGVQLFKGSGVTFDLIEDLIIGATGFDYVKVRSQTEGLKSNVDPLTIDTVSPVPAGHLYCRNEYRSTGGRDVEVDKDFQVRIKEGANIAATGTTLSKINQVFLKINPDIFKVYFQGINTLGQPILAVATTNGSSLNSGELAYLKSRSYEYLSLTELPLLEGSPSLEIKNIEFQYIDISFRAILSIGSDVDLVRKRIQIAMSKYLDWRYWNPSKKVEWDDLLQIAKNDPQVEYIPDTFFTPSADISVDPTKLPRIRGFILLDSDGGIASGDSVTINPVYYPSDPNLFFQTTILPSI